MLSFYKLLANRYQRFTSSTTWTAPVNVTAVFVRAQGAGGGGGGGSTRVATVAGHGGSGGGSGQIVEGFTTVSGTMTVTVGVGGAGGSPGDTEPFVPPPEGIQPTDGIAGGNSTFGSITALGGLGGGHRLNGSPVGELLGATRLPVGTPGGTGSASASNPIQLIGKRGMAGLHGSSSGGGNDASYTGASTALIYGTITPPYLACSAAIAKGGSGASTEYGPGGAGGLVADPGHTPPCGTQDDLDADPTPPLSYGAGGGGGGPHDLDIGLAGAGSAGADGLIEIWFLEPATLDADVICGINPPPPPIPGETGAEWKLFRISWLHDPEPFDITHLESQETNHGYHGFHFEREGWLEIRSDATVALTIVVDGVTQTPSYTISSTGGNRRKVYIPFRGNKGKLYRYLLDSADAFHVYKFQVRTKGWDDGTYQMMQPLTGIEAPFNVDAERGPDPRII